MKLHLKIPLCFFDLETTGINISQDRIIEIAVIKLMPNGETIRKTNLINPTIPIPAESTANNTSIVACVSASAEWASLKSLPP